MARFDAGPQPSGRPAAPGRLGYVQAFCNSFWELGGSGAECWTDPPALARWLRLRGFTAGADAADLRRALALREALRALFLANRDGGQAPFAVAAADAIAREVAAGAALTPRLRDGVVEPAGTGADAACALAIALVVAASGEGTFERIKACPHEHCGWVFFDASRNRSAQWCSMRICGNRTKGARHRRRSAAAQNG